MQDFEARILIKPSDFTCKRALQWGSVICWETTETRWRWSLSSFPPECRHPEVLWSGQNNTGLLDPSENCHWGKIFRSYICLLCFDCVCLTPLSVQFELEVCLCTAKNRVHTEVEEEHFVDPSQTVHSEELHCYHSRQNAPQVATKLCYVLQWCPQQLLKLKE